MLKAVIFDMDGVLIDSEYTYFESKSQILKEAGVVVEESYHYQYMGTTREFMWQGMKDEFNLPLSLESYIKKMDDLRQAMLEKDGTRPIPHVQDFVKRLAAAGLTLAVASSSSLAEIQQSLDDLELTEYFSACVSTEEVKHSKPAPDVYLEALRRIGFSPAEALGIEDTTNGSKSVKNAEMFCIGFANPSFPPQDLTAADVVVSSFESLTAEDLVQLKVKNTKSN